MNMSAKKVKQSIGEVKLESFKLSEMDSKPDEIYIDLEHSIGKKSYTLSWHNLSASIEMKHQTSSFSSIKSRICCSSEEKSSKIKQIIKNGKHFKYFLKLQVTSSDTFSGLSERNRQAWPASSSDGMMKDLIGSFELTDVDNLTFYAKRVPQEPEKQLSCEL